MITISYKNPLETRIDFGVKLESLLTQIEGQLGIAYKVYLDSTAKEVLCSAIEYSKDNDFTVSLVEGSPFLIRIRGLTCRGVDNWFNSDNEPVSPVYIGINPKLIELIELLVKA